jgi:hypothetical protein
MCLNAPRFASTLRFNHTLGRHFGPVFGHSGALFEHLQRYQLFSAVIGAQDGGYRVGFVMALAQARKLPIHWRRLG